MWSTMIFLLGAEKTCTKIRNFRIFVCICCLLWFCSPWSHVICNGTVIPCANSSFEIKGIFKMLGSSKWKGRRQSRSDGSQHHLTGLAQSTSKRATQTQHVTIGSMQKAKIRKKGLYNTNTGEERLACFIYALILEMSSRKWAI